MVHDRGINAAVNTAQYVCNRAIAQELPEFRLVSLCSDSGTRKQTTSHHRLKQEATSSISCRVHVRATDVDEYEKRVRMKPEKDLKNYIEIGQEIGVEELTEQSKKYAKKAGNKIG